MRDALRRAHASQQTFLSAQNHAGYAARHSRQRRPQIRNVFPSCHFGTDQSGARAPGAVHAGAARPPEQVAGADVGRKDRRRKRAGGPEGRIGSSGGTLEEWPAIQRRGGRIADSRGTAGRLGSTHRRARCHRGGSPEAAGFNQATGKGQERAGRRSREAAGFRPTSRRKPKRTGRRFGRGPEAAGAQSATRARQE